MRRRRFNKKKSVMKLTTDLLKQRLSVFFLKLSKMAVLAVALIMVTTLILKFKLIPQAILGEVLPFYKVSSNVYAGGKTNNSDKLLTLNLPTNETQTQVDKANDFENNKTVTDDDLKNNLITFDNKNTSEDLINTQNVEYQSPEYFKIQNHFDHNISSDDLAKMKDISFLKNNFYIVDQETDITKKLFDADNFAKTNLKLKDNSGPKVLIFNTHASEVFKDSKNRNEGVQGLGIELQKILKEKYGIESIFHDGIYDEVNGQHQVLGAYQRMTPDIEQILKDNPSIEVCIDIHRDGLPDNIHLVTDINGKPTAQIMLVNGISKIFDSKGNLVDAPGVPNPNLPANLAFSFNLKLASNSMYPNFMRKIYIHAYRYSTFMRPKSCLLEVGSQTNTYEEAKNAMEPFADILANTILTNAD